MSVTASPQFSKDQIRDYIETNQLVKSKVDDISFGMSIFYRSMANVADLQLIKEIQREIAAD